MNPRHVIGTSVLGALVIALVAVIGLGALPLGPDPAPAPTGALRGAPVGASVAAAADAVPRAGRAPAAPTRSLRAELPVLRAAGPARAAQAPPRRQASQRRGRCRGDQRAREGRRSPGGHPRGGRGANGPGGGRA